MERLKRKSFVMAVIGLSIAIVISLGFLLGATIKTSNDEVDTTQIISAGFGGFGDLGQRIILNETELQLFIDKHYDYLRGDLPEFEIISFITAAEKYDRDFFANKYLAIYIVEGGTASHKPSFRQVRQTGGFYEIHINRNKLPVGNTDIMHWIIIAEISREVAPNSVRFIIHRN